MCIGNANCFVVNVVVYVVKIGKISETFCCCC